MLSNELKGHYYFKDNGKRTIIQEFDYNYVRNSLIRVFDKKSPKEYTFNVVVSSPTYEDETFDVRTLNLKHIMYDNDNLCVYDMMMDDIYFDTPISVQNLPVPPLLQKYNAFKKGELVYNALQKRETNDKKVEPVVPVIKRTRVEVRENDERVPKIVDMFPEVNSLKVLDWVVNYEICLTELSTANTEVSNSQMQLAKTLQTHSEYIHTVFNSLKSTLNDALPTTPTWTQKLFGTKKEHILDNDQINVLISALQNSIQIEPNKFEGISVLFDDLSSSIKKIKESIDFGIKAAKFVLSNDSENYQFELYENRLALMNKTTDITELSIIGINKQFLADLNKLSQVKDSVVPLLYVKLQNQINKKLDNDTIDIIKNLSNL